MDYLQFTDFRNNSKQYFDKVENGNSFIIIRKGKPVATLKPFKEEINEGWKREVKKIKLGRGAAGILMDTDGMRVFVACSADNNIAVIDLKTLEVTARLEVGGNPDGLAWAIRP